MGRGIGMYGKWDWRVLFYFILSPFSDPTKWCLVLQGTLLMSSLLFFYSFGFPTFIFCLSFCPQMTITLHGSLYSNKRNTRLTMMKQILVSQNHNLTKLFELPAISASYPPSKQYNWLNSCDFSMLLVHVYIDFDNFWNHRINPGAWKLKIFDRGNCLWL